jgi:hypothetical protein
MPCLPISVFEAVEKTRDRVSAWIERQSLADELNSTTGRHSMPLNYMRDLLKVGG